MSQPVMYRAPDGGWGWVIVIASFMLQALSVGIAYTFGIIYVDLLDFFEDSKSSTAWIGSIQPAMLYFVCVITGPLLIKCGWRQVTILGTVISATGLCLSYLAPNIYVLFITYGFITGFGYGLMYMASMVIVQHYFDARRSLATGIAVSGSGMGTVIFGVVTTELLEYFHWRITILIEGAITLVLGLVCAALIRPLPEETASDETDPLLGGKINPALVGSSYGTPDSTHSGSPTTAQPGPTDKDCAVTASPSRDDGGEDVLGELRPTTPPAKNLANNDIFRSSSASPGSSRGNPSPMPDDMDIAESSCCSCWTNNSCLMKCDDKFRLSLLKNPIMIIICFSVICFCFGYHVPYTFTTERAIHMLNIKDTDASWLVSIMGIANLSSRLVFGWVGDYSATLRRVMLGAVITLCGVLNALMFLFTTLPLLIIYSVFFGIMSGCFASMVPVVLVDQMGLELIEFTLGQVLASGSIAFLIASPMSGWIIQETGSHDAPFLVVGVAQIVGGLVFQLIPLVRKFRPCSCHPVVGYDEKTIRRQRRRSRLFSESIA